MIIIIIIIIIKRQFIRRSNMARVITRAPHNVRCSYSAKQLVTEVGPLANPTFDSQRHVFSLRDLYYRWRCFFIKEKVFYSNNNVWWWWWQYGGANPSSSLARADATGRNQSRARNPRRYSGAARQRCLPRNTQAVAAVRRHTVRSLGRSDFFSFLLPLCTFSIRNFKCFMITVSSSLTSYFFIAAVDETQMCRAQSRDGFMGGAGPRAPCLPQTEGSLHPNHSLFISRS